jgi:hypothetical protein
MRRFGDRRSWGISAGTAQQMRTAGMLIARALLAFIVVIISFELWSNHPLVEREMFVANDNCAHMNAMDIGPDFYQDVSEYDRHSKDLSWRQKSQF